MGLAFHLLNYVWLVVVQGAIANFNFGLNHSSGSSRACIKLLFSQLLQFRQMMLNFIFFVQQFLVNEPIFFVYFAHHDLSFFTQSIVKTYARKILCILQQIIITHITMIKDTVPIFTSRQT